MSDSRGRFGAPFGSAPRGPRLKQRLARASCGFDLLLLRPLPAGEPRIAPWTAAIRHIFFGEPRAARIAAFRPRRLPLLDERIVARRRALPLPAAERVADANGGLDDERRAAGLRID